MRIGILCGEEETFPAAFLQQMQGQAEMVQIGGLRLGENCPYDLIFDRVSHRVEFYRTYLQSAVLAGKTRVINDPFRTSTDNRFLQRQRANEIGLAVPRSVLLPSRDYPPEVPSEALGNLIYPLPWEEILEYVGLPAGLRVSNSKKPLRRVTDLKDLWAAYGQTGRQVAELVQLVQADHHLLCLGVGREVFAVPMDPASRKLLVEKPIRPDLTEMVTRQTRELLDRSGYQLAAVEFALVKGVPHFLDLDPFPDLEWWTLSERFFPRVVSAAVDMVKREVGRRPGTGFPFEVKTKTPQKTPARRERNLSNTKVRS